MQTKYLAEYNGNKCRNYNTNDSNSHMKSRTNCIDKCMSDYMRREYKSNCIPKFENILFKKQYFNKFLKFCLNANFENKDYYFVF